MQLIKHNIKYIIAIMSFTILGLIVWQSASAAKFCATPGWIFKNNNALGGCNSVRQTDCKRVVVRLSGFQKTQLKNVSLLVIYKKSPLNQTLYNSPGTKFKKGRNLFYGQHITELCLNYPNKNCRFTNYKKNNNRALLQLRCK
ncbi:MAG: hypothetical protein K0U12_01790 [Gammaproteobacteria bacterium]|nr:hypothetical protein [Gammaproteobacteria bacterium]